MDRSCSSLHLEQDSKQKLCFGYTARVNVVSACKMMGGGAGGEGVLPCKGGKHLDEQIRHPGIRVTAHFL